MKMLVGIGLVAALAMFAVAAGAAPKQGAPSALVKRGAYLVSIAACNDCHTPMKMGPNGPERDMSRLLSGHPESVEMPAPPALGGPWLAAVGTTFTAWAGPWGMSFTANLTPDPETGLGKWTVQNFIETIRTGRHQGRGREILPPMPWDQYKNMTDADLKAVFAYLQSIPPLRNRVPAPIPPPAGSGGPGVPATAGGGGPAPAGGGAPAAGR